MLSWIGENLGTILVGLILAAVVAGILVRMIRNRKKRKILLWLRLRKLPDGRCVFEEKSMNIAVI